MLEVNMQTKADTIFIDQELTENLVFEHNRIKLLSKLIPKIDKYIYTCHRNVVISNHDKMLIVYHVVYTLISDNIT